MTRGQKQVRSKFNGCNGSRDVMDSTGALNDSVVQGSERREQPEQSVSW
jgi:hypothetical protein